MSANIKTLLTEGYGGEKAAAMSKPKKKKPKK
jgi:hypothetical protein